MIKGYKPYTFGKNFVCVKQKEGTMVWEIGDFAQYKTDNELCLYFRVYCGFNIYSHIPHDLIG